MYPTCIAMTSGSMLETNLVNSGQLFFTRRRKLLAFHVMNLRGCFLAASSADILSLSVEGGASVGFLAEPSFPTGWKKRFIVVFFEALRAFYSVLFPTEQKSLSFTWKRSSQDPFSEYLDRNRLLYIVRSIFVKYYLRFSSYITKGFEMTVLPLELEN